MPLKSFKLLEDVPKFSGVADKLEMFIKRVDEIREHVDEKFIALFDIRVRYRIDDAANITLINNNNVTNWEEVKIILRENFKVYKRFEDGRYNLHGHNFQKDRSNFSDLNECRYNGQYKDLEPTGIEKFATPTENTLNCSGKVSSIGYLGYNNISDFGKNFDSNHDLERLDVIDKDVEMGTDNRKIISENLDIIRENFDNDTIGKIKNTKVLKGNCEKIINDNIKIITDNINLDIEKVNFDGNRNLGKGIADLDERVTNEREDIINTEKEIKSKNYEVVYENIEVVIENMDNIDGNFNIEDENFDGNINTNENIGILNENREIFYMKTDNTDGDGRINESVLNEREKIENIDVEIIEYIEVIFENIENRNEYMIFGETLNEGKVLEGFNPNNFNFREKMGDNFKNRIKHLLIYYYFKRRKIK